jgi:hypothetical protein
MKEIKKDNKIFLSTFLAALILAVVPALLFKFILPSFINQDDYWNFFDSYLIGYYFIFLVLFFISVIVFLTGFRKKKIKNRKIFLIYYPLLFLATCFGCFIILSAINPSPFAHSQPSRHCDSVSPHSSSSLDLGTCYGDSIALKPVIYLYPPRQEQISVQLDYNGQITDVYPQFNDKKSQIWHVLADPDGSLIDSSDGRNYSYLFWEGQDHNQYDLSTGFVVRGSDTARFLQDKLAEIGLEPKEYNDFIVFWLPKMQHNPYNLIHFAGKEYTDSAKLNISPEPDSVLRVFMVFKPLKQPITIQPQSFNEFSRNGLTVVEWGGSELK